MEMLPRCQNIIFDDLWIAAVNLDLSGAISGILVFSKWLRLLQVFAVFRLSLSLLFKCNVHFISLATYSGLQLSQLL